MTFHNHNNFFRGEWSHDKVVNQSKAWDPYLWRQRGQWDQGSLPSTYRRSNQSCGLHITASTVEPALDLNTDFLASTWFIFLLLPRPLQKRQQDSPQMKCPTPFNNLLIKCTLWVYYMPGPPCKIWGNLAWMASSQLSLSTYMLQSCPTLWDLMQCSQPGSSVPGILQARILEWVAVPSSRGPSHLRDHTRVSCVSYTGRHFVCLFFTNSATWEVLSLRRTYSSWSPGLGTRTSSRDH